METVAYALMAAGSIYAATNQPKPPKPKTPGAPPTAAEGLDETAKKRRRKMPPAAQMFKDEDLRLGTSGKLGL